MKKSTRIIIGVTIFLLLIFGGILFLNFYIKEKIIAAIDTEFPDSELDYEEISVNIFSGNTSLSLPRLQLKNLDVNAESFMIRGFGYREYFFNNRISLGGIRIIEPKILIKKYDSFPEEPLNGKENFSKNLLIDKIHIKGGSITVSKGQDLPEEMFLSLKKLDLFNVLVNEETIKGKLPIEYDRLEVSSDSLFYDINEEYDIAAKNFKIHDAALSVSSFSLIPNFSRREFDKRLSMEKDLYSLAIKKINIKDLEWDYVNDTLQVKSPLTKIAEADFSIYRNKLLPDDPSIRPMYSELIRNMGMKIKFDSIVLENTRLIYEEQLNADRPPAMLKFNNINSSMRNVTNIGMDDPDFPQTNIRIEARFMDESPIVLNWEFYVNDLQEDFRIHGELGALSASSVNPYLKPARNIELQGTIQSMYYNFYGNEHSATGNMRMNFNDFKVHILKKNDSGKRGFLSDLVNLFINNETKKGNYEIKELKVERNKAASFWNYFWLCIRQGVTKSLLKS